MVIVQKYGGTSVGNAERMISVSDIISNFLNDHQVIAVVSAMSSYIKAEGTTSKLIEASRQAIMSEDFSLTIKSISEHHLSTIREAVKNPDIYGEVLDYIEQELDWLMEFLEAINIIGEISPKSHDVIISIGEKLSASILAAILQDKGIPAEYIDLSNIASTDYKITNQNFYNELENRLGQLLQPLLDKKVVPILPGYIGPIPEGIISAIGRGYTDFTAALAACSVRATELQIWKEVEGIFTANPKLVEDAQVLDSLTPKEAAELTYFGSEVIHPFTMERVTRKDIPVRIKNTFNPQGTGTIVVEKEEKEMMVKSITAKKGVIILNIESNRMLNAYGFMAKVFRTFDKYHTIIDLISTSEVNISLTLDRDDNLADILEELSELGHVDVEYKRAIVAMVGKNMFNKIGIAGRMFTCLANAGINIEMISQGSSEINISCVIQEDKADDAIIALHKEFISS